MSAIPEVAPGHKRQWVRCKTCGRVAYYDFIPFSLSNPIMEMPCGHDVGRGFHDATVGITEAEAISAIDNAIWDENARRYQ